MKRDAEKAGLFLKNVFYLCSLTYLTGHPRSITGKKMCGRMTTEEIEEMREIFEEVGEFKQFILTNLYHLNNRSKHSL